MSGGRGIEFPAGSIISAVVELTEISLQAGSQPLFDKFSLTLPDPGIYLVHGPTGSGKSLICKMISGRLSPQAGEALVDGTPAHRHAARHEGDFYSEAIPGDTYNETIRDYIATELAAAGASPGAAAEYFGLIDSYFPRGTDTQVSTMSFGERLILHAVLAAAAPGRIAVLDGQLGVLSESAVLFCWQMLQSSLVDHEKFIVLTAQSVPTYLEGESTAIRLSGGLPVRLAG
jgi:ABC-type multidrug transport system ATPase subunit